MKAQLARFCVRICGFKPSRVSEWRAVVQSEAKTIGWRSVLIELLAGALRLGRVSRTRWRRRLRFGCGRCIVYDRKLRKCRVPGRQIGCGCWMPAKALVGRPEAACWRVSKGDAVAAFQ